MKLQRRQFVGGLGALALTGMPKNGLAKTSHTVGANTVTSVSDGHLTLPGSMVFDGLPADPLQTIIEQHNLSTAQVQPACNLTLLHQQDRLVLFDAGSGAGFMPSAGEMIDSLDALGVSPEDITHVVFTHAHPDHLWGILDDFDDPVFPEATLMIGQAEWDYWTDPDTVNTIGEERASFAVGAARRLAAVEDQMVFFKDQDEILSGVLAHSTPGHTPGHMAFEIRDGSDALLVGGDAIGNHHIAFARPDWASGSDQDPDLGIKTRMRLLDQLATDNMTLMGFHLPNGGLGRVERVNSAYRFVAKDA